MPSSMTLGSKVRPMPTLERQALALERRVTEHPPAPYVRVCVCIVACEGGSCSQENASVDMKVRIFPFLVDNGW